jgi:hypothetical protein
MGFQHSADGGRRNPQLLSDLRRGQTFLVEAGQLVAVYDQPRPSADAPLLAGLLQCSGTVFSLLAWLWRGGIGGGVHVAGAAA